MWGSSNVINHPDLAMVTIPPKKIVMTGVWFMALFYPHDINPTLRRHWDWETGSCDFHTLDLKQQKVVQFLLDAHVVKPHE